MATQKALIVPEIGKPVIETTRPIPTPSEHQLLIKVTTAGLNPHDQKIRDNNVFGVFGMVFPCILSIDIAGTVTGVGSEVKGFKIGDTVFSQSMPISLDACGLQQYALIDSRISAHIPAGISDDQAITLGVNGVAPFVNFFDASGMGIPPPFPDNEAAKTFDYAAQTLAIVGGGSNCGKLGVQFAALAGIGRIIVIASLSNTDELKSYGATHIIDRHLSDAEIKSQVQAIIGDELVYVFDAINTDHTLAISLLSSYKKGTAGTIAGGSADESRIGEKKAGYRAVHTIGDSHRHYETVGAGFWRELPGWVESGKIKPLSFKVLEGGLNADGVNKVLDAYRDGKNPGQWHVHPNA